MLRFTDIFKSDPSSILQGRKAGMIYTADFGSGEGKYVSSTLNSADPVDVKIQISPRVEVRIAFIFDGEKISGLKLTKINNQGKIESMHLSTIDMQGVLGLLEMFTAMDLKALAKRNLILDEKIISDPAALETFLKTVAADPNGSAKLAEVAKNFGLLKPGDIDILTARREAVAQFDRLLNVPDEFAARKAELGAGKDEAVWQRFFTDNDWILGADCIEILDERTIDTENITDYIVRSYDGFADIVELKLPSAPFWTADLCPTAELTRALMQCMRYIRAIETRINDLELNKKLSGTAIVKPRITLIYGRSNTWTDDQKETYRVLNANLQSISIVTYDHVLERAKRMTSTSTSASTEPAEDDDINPDDIPF